MADLGHKLTDKELEALEKKIAKVYASASKDLKAKADEYFAKFKIRDEDMRQQLENGKITKEYYQQWRMTQMGRGERVKALEKECAKRVTEANKVAAAYINDTTPQVYSLNHNYAAYTIESVAGDVGFTMWDESTVRNLMTQGDEKILPKASINVPKDEIWNRKKIANEITAGILQGESIGKIANRFISVTNTNRTSAVRNARTAVTNAQNSGRQSSYEQASDMGIEVVKEWVSTLDDRTRESHRDMDGIRVPYDQKFPNGLMYPADYSGDASEVYNCRCTMVVVLPQFTGQKTRVTYREWEQGKTMADFAPKTFVQDNYSDIVRPVRPKSSDFDNRDDYAKARAEYKVKRAEYDEKLERVTTEYLDKVFPMLPEEAKEWAKANDVKLGENWQLIDPKVLRVLCERQEKLFADFPQVKEFYNALGTRFEITYKMDRSYDAEATGGINMGYAAANAHDFFKGAFEYADGKEFVVGSRFTRIFDHEYGHNVAEVQKFNVTTKDAIALKKEIIDSLYGKSGMSEYATTNEDELYAEAFAAWYGGERSDFANEFAGIMRRHPLTSNFDRLKELAGV